MQGLRLSVLEGKHDHMEWLRKRLPFCCCLVASLAGPGLCSNYVDAKIPPAPSRPSLTSETQQSAITDLDADDYHTRHSASRLLEQGGEATVGTLLTQLKDLGPEGRIRALQVAQRIFLSALAHQDDEAAFAIRQQLDEMRLVDNELLGSRADTFNLIHQRAMERAAVRKLLRANMVIEFRQANRSFPGLAKRDVTSELPERFFMGENWQGDEDDLQLIEFLLLLGEQQLGNQRAIYRIQGCPVSLETLQDMAAGLQVSVEERGKARLGVGARSPMFVENPPWEVTEVAAGSAAAHAGLVVGDTIVRLNEKPLNTFHELTERLEVFEPADEVSLDILSQDAEIKVVTMERPYTLEELGVTIDAEFLRFPIIKEVAEKSKAAEIGLSEMYRIDRVNGQAVNSPSNFLLVYTRQPEGKPITLELRQIKRLPVMLRGWVGPYR